MIGWWWWEHLTTDEAAGLDPATTVVILPVAAIEQHGPHLPLGTDRIICDAILDAGLARLPPLVGPVLRLPTQGIGCSTEHASYPGTLTLSAEAAVSLWTDIGRHVAAAGLRKLILFNAHGGQVALVDIVAQRLRREARLLVVRASYFHLPLPDGLLDEAEARFGWHGGTLETSLMLHIAPELVRREHVRRFASAAASIADRHRVLAVEGAAGMGWLAEDLNPAGVTGDAAAATAELGEVLLAHYAGQLATLIGEVQRLAWPQPLPTMGEGPPTEG
ncbi:MAG: creatininase family protein [Rhodospirillales bacterium]